VVWSSPVVPSIGPLTHVHAITIDLRVEVSSPGVLRRLLERRASLEKVKQNQRGSMKYNPMFHIVLPSRERHPVPGIVQSTRGQPVR
jgi:hypothetical protein